MIQDMDMDSSISTSPTQVTAADIRERCEQVAKLTEDSITGMLQSAVKEMSEPLQKWFAYFETVMLMQNEELALFREMESNARLEIMNQEVWDSITERLDAFRDRVRKENEARMQSAKPAGSFT